MCNDCKKQLDSHISSIKDHLRMSSRSLYDYSEPLSCGGPGSPKVYPLLSPFNKQSGQQYSLHSVSSGASTGLFLVSSDRTSSIPSFTSSDSGTPEVSNISGILGICPANNTITMDNSWYDLVDGNGVLYVTVSSNQSVYVVVQFRRKR